MAMNRCKIIITLVLTLGLQFQLHASVLDEIYLKSSFRLFLDDNEHYRLRKKELEKFVKIAPQDSYNQIITDLNIIDGQLLEGNNLYPIKKIKDLLFLVADIQQDLPSGFVDGPADEITLLMDSILNNLMLVTGEDKNGDLVVDKKGFEDLKLAYNEIEKKLEISGPDAPMRAMLSQREENVIIQEDSDLEFIYKILKSDDETLHYVFKFFEKHPSIELHTVTEQVIIGEFNRPEVNFDRVLKLIRFYGRTVSTDQVDYFYELESEIESIFEIIASEDNGELDEKNIRSVMDELIKIGDNLEEGIDRQVKPIHEYFSTNTVEESFQKSIAELKLQSSNSIYSNSSSKKIVESSKEFLRETIIEQEEMIEQMTDMVVRRKVFGSEKSEVLYLMGSSASDKESAARAFTALMNGKSKEGLSDHFYEISSLNGKDDLWSHLGSSTGYVGSNDVPPFLQFLVDHSNGQLKIEVMKGDDKGFKVIENPDWSSKLLGFNKPEEAVLYLSNFQNGSKKNKDTLLLKAIRNGVWEINKPGGGLKEIHVPINIIIDSEEGLGAVSSKDLSGTRFGRPKNYSQQLELYNSRFSDKEFLKSEILKSNRITSFASEEGKGISEVLLSEIPKNRIVLAKPISPKGLQLKAQLLLKDMNSRFKNSSNYSKIQFSWGDDLLKFIQEFQFNSEDGVNAIKDNVKSFIENSVMDAIVDGRITEKSSDTFNLVPVLLDDNTWSLKFISKETGDTFSQTIRATSGAKHVGKLSKDEIKRLLKMSERLKKELFGQDYVVDQVAKALLSVEQRRVLAKDLSSAQKATIFPFLGPTSTGKTELGKLMAKELFGSKENASVIDFSKITNVDDVKTAIFGKKLSGGLIEESQFMQDYDRSNGRLVVILDEVANAGNAKETLKSLYPILYEEIVTSFSDGKERPMSNVVIVMTGNAGEEWYQNLPTSAGQKILRRQRRKIYNNMMDDKLAQEKTLSAVFTEALQARMDEIFWFSSLDDEPVRKLINFKLSETLKEFSINNPNKRGWSVKFASEKQYLAFIDILEEEAFQLQSQGRSINNYLRKFERELEYALLSSDIDEGSELLLNIKGVKNIGKSEGTSAKKKLLEFEIWEKNNSKPLTFAINKTDVDFFETRPNSEKIMTAYHEAGHNIVAKIFFGDKIRSEGIEIVPGVMKSGDEWIQYLGVSLTSNLIPIEPTMEYAMERVAGLIAGYKAEEFVTTGRRSTAGKSNDMQSARDLIEKAILVWGVSDEWDLAPIGEQMSISEYKVTLNDEYKIKLEKLIKKYVDKADNLSEKAMLYNYDLLEEIAVRLAAKGQISGDELESIYKEYHIVRPLEWMKDKKGKMLSDSAKKALNSKKAFLKDAEYLPSLVEIREGVRLPKEVIDVEELLDEQRIKVLSNVDSHKELIPFADNLEEFDEAASRIPTRYIDEREITAKKLADDIKLPKESYILDKNNINEAALKSRVKANTNACLRALSSILGK